MEKRTLEFRVWSEEDSMMYPDAYPQDDLSVNEEINRDSQHYMQYTGKKDSKGNKIFEGDIIEFDRKEWGGNDNIHLVTWDNVNAEWCWGGGCTGDMEWRTVIGNIYETPDLIPNT